MEPSKAGSSTLHTMEKYEYTPENSVTGYHPKSGIVEKVNVPAKKIKLYPNIRSELCQKEFLNNISQLWKNDISGKIEEVEVITDPFKVCVIDNFIEGKKMVHYIRQDLNEIHWEKRTMDLYEFFQSKDLKHIDLEYIKAFYEFMKSTVMDWVASIMGFDLEEISATCSCYNCTDYLLVHDDQREDRMVAFVYYLTSPEGWESDKGGSLDLFSKDEKGHPSKITRSILPKSNRLVLFPVTNDSYHQVAEVTTREDARLSINGWFHVKTPPIFQIPHFEHPECGLFGEKTLKPQKLDVLLESWIDEKYLSTGKNLQDIQKYIEENSEISLKNFFRDEALDEVQTCLQILDEDEEKWSRPAPSNRSWYEVLCTDSLPFSLERFLSLFQSEIFFDYLKKITDLDLKSMKFEFQRWTPGSYCLLSDHNWNNKQELDVIIYFPLETQPNDIVGGRIQYVNTEEEVQEALITIEPLDNTLNVVYRDTARFTKYYSKLSRCKLFYLLICSYSE